MNEQLWWHIARASGLVSWYLLTTSVLCGTLLSTRLLGSRVVPAWLLDLHRFVGGLSVVFIGVHLGGLVADSYVHFGLADLLVPLASDWQPVGVAWGVVALYLLVAIEVTSLLRSRLPAKLWRKVHRTSFLLWVLATMHLLGSGTDVGNALVQWSVFVPVVLVTYAFVVRFLSPKPDRAPRQATATATAPMPTSPAVIARRAASTE